MRFYNKKTDIIPAKKSDQSLIDYIIENNGNQTEICGAIGQSGTKVHKFDAYYLPVNGENVIVYYSSVCGAETYKSLISGHIGEEITCKKCAKHKFYNVIDWAKNNK